MCETGGWQHKELHCLVHMITQMHREHTCEKKTTLSKSSRFFSDRRIRAALPLVKHWRWTQSASKSSAWFTCTFFTAVSMRRSPSPALPARLPTALYAPFTGNDWFLTGHRLQSEMVSKAVSQCCIVHSPVKSILRADAGYFNEVFAESNVCDDDIAIQNDAKPNKTQRKDLLHFHKQNCQYQRRCI